MKQRKRAMAAVCAVAMFASAVTGVWAEYDPSQVTDPSNPVMATKAEGSASIQVNGTTVADAVTYETEDGFTMLPIRSVCETLEIDVNWNNDAKLVELVKLPLYVTFRVGEDGYTLARTAPMQLGKAPELKDSLTYVPVALFSELLGADVSMEGSVLSICYGEDEPETGMDAAFSYAEVTESGDRYLVIDDPDRGEIVLMVAADTVVKDKQGNDVSAAAIPAGAAVQVKYGPIMTASIPAQNTPLEIVEIGEMPMSVEAMQAPETLTVQADVRAVLEEGRVLLSCLDGDYEEILAVVNEDTVITGPNGESRSKEDIVAGARVEAELSRAMSRSIPPQSYCYAMRILKVA